MSRIVIVILIYHRHKPIDSIFKKSYLSRDECRIELLDKSKQEPPQAQYSIHAVVY
jgi:hypothetical protein